MPMQISKMQKAQNVICSFVEATLQANEKAPKALTALLSLAWRVNGVMTLLEPWHSECVRWEETREVYRTDPSIMQTMKDEKMYPKGRDVLAACS